MKHILYFRRYIKLSLFVFVASWIIVYFLYNVAIVQNTNEVSPNRSNIPPTLPIKKLSNIPPILPIRQARRVLYPTRKPRSRKPWTFPHSRRPPDVDLVEQRGYCDNRTRLETVERDTKIREKYHRLCTELEVNKTRYFTLEAHRIRTFNHVPLVTAAGTCDRQTDVIVLVHSLHDYVTKRAAIRSTWGRAIRDNIWLSAKLLLNVRMLFVHGVHRKASMERALKEEITKYGDIIQGDFYEDYRNMTLKSLFGLKWVTTFCPEAKYLVKVDDDVLLNLPALLEVLKSWKPTRSMVGPLSVSAQTMRVGKWALTPEEYPFFYLPPYLSGSTYIIGSDIILDIYSAAERFRKQIHIDDLFITGILPRTLNITIVSHPGFAFMNSRKPTPCEFILNRTLNAIFSKTGGYFGLYNTWHSIMNRANQSCT